MPQTSTASPRTTRSRVVLSTLLGMLALTGCGSDGGNEAEVPGPAISPILDTDRESSASLGPEGGIVTATAADGTEYALSIPVDALIDETEIALTPIIRIDDLPMSGGFVAGVHFEPSGLELFRTATLRVTQPAAPSLGTDEVLAGFVYDGAGENLGLALTEATGTSFTVPVNHFSGGGGGAANPNELAAASTSGGANAFTARLLNAILVDDTQDAESVLRDWYQTLVKPRLQAAVSNDAALERALNEYRRWLNAEGAVPLPIDVATLISESQNLAVGAFREAIVRANELCERNASFEEAEKALRWQRRAESVLPADVLLQNNLDRSAVLADLCVQVVIVSTSFPQSPVAGVPELLEVVFGFAFGNGPTEFSPNMVAFILATGAAPAGATEFTNENGRVALTLTPDGGSVSIEVDACIGNGGFNSGQLVAGLVCQEAFIVRGLVVSPQEVVLGPGAAQQFSAQLLGVDEPVTWSATGGTIDPSGIYTAGSTEGSFSVTATSNEDPNVTASAVVTIQTSEPLDYTGLYSVDNQYFDQGDPDRPVLSEWDINQNGDQLLIDFDSPGCGRGILEVQINGSSISGCVDECPTFCIQSGTIMNSPVPTISGVMRFEGNTNETYLDFVAKRETRISIGPTNLIETDVDAGGRGVFYRLFATVAGNDNKDISWSATGGTLIPNDDQAEYIPGSTAGTFEITATSVADTNLSAVATVIISADVP